MKVTVIGQGYVGLPLAISAAQSGHIVHAVDVDLDKINKLKLNISPVEDISSALIGELINKGLYLPTSDFKVVEDSEIIVLCVPTPLDKNQEPDLSYIFQAVTTMGPFVKAGSLVVLESTVEPGTTRNYLLPLLSKVTGLQSSEFEVSFSPERIDPANKKWNLKNTPKLVSGITLNAKQRAVNFYSKFVDTLVECNSTEVAEASKLLENSFRLINISFINEFAMFCRNSGIEVGEVIDAASSKPYGFMAFYPGLGAGGHCIPIDPMYLSSYARKIGSPIKLIDLAANVNLSIPSDIVAQAISKLGDLKGKKILVIGISYKPNVSDIRESPAIRLILLLRNAKADVYWHDNVVKSWGLEVSSDLNKNYDLVILATKHDYLNSCTLPLIPTIDVSKST